ncbi:MAG: tripartite tricarboxylate transporter TctB family protein [Hyphomicrobiaceae bacterium]
MRLNQQTASGLFFVAFGTAFLWLGSSLTMGTAGDMGPGYVPRALAIGCVIVGAILLAIAAVGRGLRDGVTFDLKAAALTTAMVAGFAAALPWLGLPLTVFLCMISAFVSGESYRLGVMFAIALGLAVFATLLFAWGLKLQIPLLPAIPGLALPGLK